MKKMLLFFVLSVIFVSFISGEKLLILPEIKNPNSIYYPISVNNDLIVVTDAFNIFLYSAKNFNLIKKFGKQGAGPDEFLGWDAGFIWTTLLNDKIIITSRGKVTDYSLTGEYLHEVRTNQGTGFVYRKFKDKYTAYSITRYKGISMGVVNLYDKNFNKLKELIRYEEWISQRQFNPYTYKKPIPKSYKNRLYINDVNNGDIKIFNSDGSLFKLVKYKYDKVRVTKAIQKETIKAYQIDLRVKFLFRSPLEVVKRLKFPDFFPIMKQYDIVDDKIYVLTYKEVRGRHEFIVFNLDGEFLEKKMVSVPHISLTEPFPFTIKNNFIYYLYDNEKTEEWELHRAKL